MEGGVDACLRRSSLPWRDDSGSLQVHPGQPCCTESDGGGSYEHMNLPVNFDNEHDITTILKSFVRY